jgi:hypothetical protein
VNHEGKVVVSVDVSVQVASTAYTGLPFRLASTWFLKELYKCWIFPVSCFLFPFLLGSGTTCVGLAGV